MRLLLVLLAGMLAGCKGEQPPDLCKRITQQRRTGEFSPVGEF